MMTRSVFTTVFLVAGHTYLAVAQDIIRGVPTCKQCSIKAEKVSTLSGLQDKGTVEQTTVIVRNSRGTTFIAPMATPGEIHVYSPQGHYERTIGRSGTGPGEYGVIRALALLKEDSIIVYDVNPPRLSILSPQGQFVRSLSLPVLLPSENGLRTAGGFLFINGEMRTRDRSGLIVHRLRLDGTTELESFGSDGAFRADLAYSTWRLMAPTSNGLWILHANRYEFEHWDAALRKTQHLKREIGWFEPWWEYVDPGERLPTRPIAIGLDLDARGLFWAAVEVPSSRQKQELSKIAGPEGPSWEWKSHSRAFDTMVEVIDPSSRSVIASTKLDARVIGSLGNGYYVSFEEDQSGNPTLEVWRLQLHNVPLPTRKSQ